VRVLPHPVPERRQRHPAADEVRAPGRPLPLPACAPACCARATERPKEPCSAGSLPPFKPSAGLRLTGQKRRSRGVTALLLHQCLAARPCCTGAVCGRAVACWAGMPGPRARWLCMVPCAVSGFQPSAAQRALLFRHCPGLQGAQPATQAGPPRQARLHARALPAHHRQHPAPHARRQRQRRRHRRLPRRARRFWQGRGCV